MEVNSVKYIVMLTAQEMGLLYDLCMEDAEPNGTNRRRMLDKIAKNLLQVRSVAANLQVIRGMIDDC